MFPTDRSLLRLAIRTAAAAALSVLVLPGVASAQVSQDTDHRFRFGHLHVHPTSYEVHKKFWAGTLGGVLTKVGTMDAVKFPGGLIEWESPTFVNVKPAGGTKNTTVDHVAFTVPDLQNVLDRVKADGYQIVSRDKAAAFVMGPDDFLVELVESKAQKAPIAIGHIHFATSQAADMEAWYVKLLEAKRGKRGASVEASIPGSPFTFSPAATPVAGTKGRVLDHIGFEIRDLKAFTKQLEGMGIKVERFIETKLPGTQESLIVVYLTDPWGTYIELTEGLDKVQ